MRRLGHDNEPHVDERSGNLAYSLYVDAGHFGRDFTFAIRHSDLDVLITDRYRRAVLGVIAHTILQRFIVRGGQQVTQATFDDIASQVLYSEMERLEDYIGQVDREHNTSVSFFVGQAIAQQSPRPR